MQPHKLSNGSQPPADSMPEDPTITLLESYNSLNSSTITTLTSLPSPLEFLRFVAQNRPFVIRGGASDWKAVREWNVASLKEILEGVSVNVAVTPVGYESIFFLIALSTCMTSVTDQKSYRVYPILYSPCVIFRSRFPRGAETTCYVPLFTFASRYGPSYFEHC